MGKVKYNLYLPDMGKDESIRVRGHSIPTMGQTIEMYHSKNLRQYTVTNIVDTIAPTHESLSSRPNRESDLEYSADVPKIYLKEIKSQ